MTALLQPRRVVCPHCGYDGTCAPAHGVEPFRYLEDIVCHRPVAAITHRSLVEGGTLRVDCSAPAQSGEGYDEGDNGRLECRTCLGEFDIPTAASVEFVCDLDAPPGEDR